MKKSIIILLMFLSFLTGAIVARIYDYYDHGKLEKELLKENEMLDKQYEMLNKQYEIVEKEIQQREFNDSINNKE